MADYAEGEIERGVDLDQAYVAAMSILTQVALLLHGR
jgi:hypothetical protein